MFPAIELPKRSPAVFSPRLTKAIDRAETVQFRKHGASTTSFRFTRPAERVTEATAHLSGYARPLNCRPQLLLK